MNTYKVIRIYFLYAAFVLGMLNLAGCQDNYLTSEPDIPHKDNMPVEIKVFLPTTTRGVNPKREFTDGEFIHVQGVFHMDDDTDEIKYAAFRMEGGNWVQYGGNEGSINVDRFTWPNNCLTAEFTAYYLSDTQSLMQPTADASSNPATLLSSLAGKNNQPDTDPLVARSNGPVKYGHTIVLQFIHACAYLTVEEMPPGIDTYWFTQENEEGTGVSPTFYNAYKLWLNPDNTISFEFVQVPDLDYDDLVYVSGKSTSEFLEGEEKASFGVFLAPGQYDKFVIGYPGADKMIQYLNYQKKGPNLGPNGEEDPNPLNKMEENGVYTFNIARSSGIEITTPPGGPGMSDEEDPIYEVDAEKFLYSICYPRDYYVEYKGEMVKIIEQTGGNGTRLLKNVNIQWEDYRVFAPNAEKRPDNPDLWFSPEIGKGNTFDGNFHWIWNLGSPLFNTIDGTVKNLGITNVNFSYTTQDQYIPDGYTGGPGLPDYFDLSRVGALCNYLREGTIQNIWVRSKLPVETTFDPDTYDPDSDDPFYEDIFDIKVTTYTERDSEAHNIGCVVGSNLNGTISNVTIMCDMNLTVESSPESLIDDPTLSIGGIIGQNVNVINNIGTDNSVINRSPKITITNKCSDQNAAYYVGGILGYHSGGIINNIIIPDVYVDCRQSSGFNSYLGGAVGGLSNRSDGGEMLNCSVSGKIFAGKTETHSEYMASNYTGGLAGECYESYTVTGCQEVVDVMGPYNAGGYNNYIEVGTIYGVGGVFGIIQRLNNSGQTPAQINNIIGYGTTLRGPASIGNFAGIVPSDETWETDYATRDFMIKVHDNVEKYIGSE